MNTSEFIPYQSIAPIVIHGSGYTFFSGTGFFVSFPPFDEVFYVTARHCVIAPDGSEKGTLQILYHYDSQERETIIFKALLQASFKGDNGDIEEVVVYVVGDLPPERKSLLQQRALPLQHQDDVQMLIDMHLLRNDKLRIVGFPSVSKDMDYDSNKAIVMPRGFHGRLTSKTNQRETYKIEDLNWKEGNTEGFSGSPVLALCTNLEGDIIPVPLGIVVTASDEPPTVSFLSINSATDLIAEYLNKITPEI